ncbi:NAD(P)-binding Rossmann-fold superfamily protein [Striga asiatica]|uniref:NAD(P)-binding Rossmann-fold superfamily protein n=1 Tax=Striga asiatica TaxID=4170 RepID=A0A5A7PIT9_STRAF|nr:NAD(P)-binding Rossmann-fold superfamily protein [Striga asiatica]
MRGITVCTGVGHKGTLHKTNDYVPENYVEGDNSAVDAVTTDQPSGALKGEHTVVLDAPKADGDVLPVKMVIVDGTGLQAGDVGAVLPVKSVTADEPELQAGVCLTKDKDNDDKDDDDKDREADTQGSPRPKRRIKATSAVKSPYIQRSIDVVKKLDRHEKMIAIWALKKDTPDELYDKVLYT